MSSDEMYLPSIFAIGIINCGRGWPDLCNYVANEHSINESKSKKLFDGIKWNVFAINTFCGLYKLPTSLPMCPSPVPHNQTHNKPNINVMYRGQKALILPTT